MYGSQPVDGSPYLFAAFHVLLRRLVPRHPPYALRSLIFSSHKLPILFRLFAKDSYILWHNENCYIIHITLLIWYFSLLYAVVNVRLHSKASASQRMLHYFTQYISYCQRHFKIFSHFPLFSPFFIPFTIASVCVILCRFRSHTRRMPLFVRVHYVWKSLYAPPTLSNTLSINSSL